MDRALGPLLVSILLASGSAAQTLPGEVLGSQFVSEFAGGFMADLSPSDNFGRSIALLGDLDGDGRPEIAVGAPNDDDGALDTGAVWILKVRPDGKVMIAEKLSGTSPGLAGLLPFDGRFGISVAAPGDLDADGVCDLLVGASGDDDAAFNGGALWILLLNADGSVKTPIKISSATSPAIAPLIPYASFGIAVAALGDLDGNGIVDVAVGASGDGPEPGDAVGAVFVLFLDASLSVLSATKLGGTAGGLPWTLQTGDSFGYAVGALGDLDGDGVPDIAAHSNDRLFGTDGAVHVLFLDADGTVKDHVRIAGDGQAGFVADLGSNDNFAQAINVVGDIDHDGVVDLGVGASTATGGLGFNDGAVFLLFMNAAGTVKSHTMIAPGGVGGFTGPAPEGSHFGRSVAPLGDIDGDGRLDIAIGMSAYPSVVKGPGFWGALHTVRLTDGQWVPVGDGLAGTTGIPQLTGSGVPAGAEPVTLSIDGALPGATTFLVVGAEPVDLPLKGGTLVPSPELVIALATDAAGSAQLDAHWPADIPVGQTVLFQAWVQDAGGPAGWAASPGLLVTTP